MPGEVPTRWKRVNGHDAVPSFVRWAELNDRVRGLAKAERRLQSLSTSENTELYREDLRTLRREAAEDREEAAAEVDAELIELLAREARSGPEVRKPRRYRFHEQWEWDRPDDTELVIQRRRDDPEHHRHRHLINMRDGFGVTALVSFIFLVPLSFIILMSEEELSRFPPVIPMLALPLAIVMAISLGLTVYFWDKLDDHDRNHKPEPDTMTLTVPAAWRSSFNKANRPPPEVATWAEAERFRERLRTIRQALDSFGGETAAATDAEIAEQLELLAEEQRQRRTDIERDLADDVFRSA